MARWSVDQVLAAAPDEASRKAARGLARPGPWSELGATGSLVWGRCQGSGKDAYQVTVDLAEPAFRCTCPSRKHPCKHGVALLLLWAQGDRDVSDVAVAPEGAAEWSRRRTAPPPPKAPPDPEAAARRAAQREATMTAGLASFEVWLADLVRGGLAAVRRQPYRFWDDAAARLVDAQVPGLADRVRAAAGLVQRPGDWAPALLAEVGRWYAAARAWTRRPDLAPSVVADLEAYLGLTRRRDDVLAAGGVRDRWHLLGVRLGGDDRIRSQRTWLAGEATGELVLLLDFAAAGATLEAPGVVGTVVDATVARYEGGAPRRGLFTGDQRVTGDRAVLPAATDVAGALDRMAWWVAGNPWLDRVPAVVEAVPVVDGDDAWVVDAAGAALPLDGDVDRWRLLALTGGRPAPLFGEVEDGRLHVVSVAAGGEVVGL